MAENVKVVKSLSVNDREKGKFAVLRKETNPAKWRNKVQEIRLNKFTGMVGKCDRSLSRKGVQSSSISLNRLS